MSSGTQTGRDHITWIGHGTVVVAMGGTRVVVDPVLRPRILHLRRFHPVPRHALRSLDDAAELYARAPAARAMTSSVLRRGTPVTLRVSIQ